MTDIGPGSLVICVDDNWKPNYGESCPQKNWTYTIREIVFCRHERYLLEEIKNPSHHYVCGFGEASFSAFRFRPVRDDSIDIFRKLAEPKDERVSA